MEKSNDCLIGYRGLCQRIKHFFENKLMPDPAIDIEFYAAGEPAESVFHLEDKKVNAFFVETKEM